MLVHSLWPPCSSVDAGECSCWGCFGVKKGDLKGELGCVLAGVGALL